jgi:hypothetical protein
MMDEMKMLTKNDLSKSDKIILNEKQLNFLFQRTPKNHIYKRPGKGGESWDYVTGTYVKKVLNLMFGWDWDFEIIKFDILADGKQAVVMGKLTCRTEGRPIVKMQFGRAEIKFRRDTKEPLDIGNDLKAATTDCLKKCAAELGIASDVYGKAEYKEIKVHVADKPTEDQLYLINEMCERLALNDRQVKI